VRERTDEAGMTLVEMLVTMSLLAIVTTMFLSIMASVQSGVERQADRSNDNDQARLAVQELDREIRSGNVLYDPAAEAPPFEPGYSLRVYTQTNATTRTPANRCVQWRISGGELQRRDWATANPTGTVSAWRVVAENLVNHELAVPAFVLDTDPTKGGRIVNVTIVAQSDADSGNPVRISAAISGRNTSYGYPMNVCAVIPPA
jgi:prepilin-type N-terminal cleavage/methylation domain-containing protein